MTRLRTGRPDFDFRQGQGFSSWSPRPSSLLIRLILRFFPGEKQTEHEAENTPPSIAEVKNAWSFTCTPPYVFGTCYLIRHMDNSAFTNDNINLVEYEVLSAAKMKTAIFNTNLFFILTIRHDIPIMCLFYLFSEKVTCPYQIWAVRRGTEQYD
jgi:hypothetical protein